MPHSALVYGNQGSCLFTGCYECCVTETKLRWQRFHKWYLIIERCQCKHTLPKDNYLFYLSHTWCLVFMRISIIKILKPDPPGTSNQVTPLMHKAHLLTIALTIWHSSCVMPLLWVFNHSDLLSYIWIPWKHLIPSESRHGERKFVTLGSASAELSLVSFCKPDLVYYIVFCGILSLCFLLVCVCHFQNQTFQDLNQQL